MLAYWLSVYCFRHLSEQDKLVLLQEYKKKHWMAKVCRKKIESYCKQIRKRLKSAQSHSSVYLYIWVFIMFATHNKEINYCTHTSLDFNNLKLFQVLSIILLIYFSQICELGLYIGSAPWLHIKYTMCTIELFEEFNDIVLWVQWNSNMTEIKVYYNSNKFGLWINRLYYEYNKRVLWFQQKCTRNPIRVYF